MHQGATDHFSRGGSSECKNALARTLTGYSVARLHHLPPRLHAEPPSCRTGTPTKHS